MMSVIFELKRVITGSSIIAETVRISDCDGEGLIIERRLRSGLITRHANI